MCTGLNTGTPDRLCSCSSDSPADADDSLFSGKCSAVSDIPSDGSMSEVDSVGLCVQIFIELWEQLEPRIEKRFSAVDHEARKGEECKATASGTREKHYASA